MLYNTPDNASTEEVAGSAGHLAEAADKLTSAVGAFRIDSNGSKPAAARQGNRPPPFLSAERNRYRDGTDQVGLELGACLESTGALQIDRVQIALHLDSTDHPAEMEPQAGGYISADIGSSS